MDAEAFATGLRCNRQKDIRTTSISEVNFALICPRSSKPESGKHAQRACGRQRILA